MANINYDKYFKLLTRNSKYSNNNNMHGGGMQKTKPFGGFPPIHICSKEDILNLSDIKNREYSTHKSSVSIKDIMKKRRDVDPFVII